jgi:DNA polymerase-3 subunit gamma/tau
MKTVIENEHCQVDDDAIEMIAKLSDGGMRDALSILEQCLVFNDQHLTVNDVYRIYGIVSIENKIDFIKVLLSKDMVKALTLLEEMTHNGTDIKRLTIDLVDILKDVIIYKNTKNTDILFVLSSYDLEKIVPYISADEAFQFIDILMDANEKYSRSVNPSIYFEVAILKICNHVKEVKAVQEIQPVEEVEEEIVQEVKQQEEINVNKSEIIENVEQEVSNENHDTDEIPTFDYKHDEVIEEVDTNINVDINDIMNILVQARREILNEIKEKWPIIRRYLANLNTAKSASMLCDGVPVAACKGGLIISFEFMPSVNAVNYYKNYKQLSLFIKELLGEEYKFIAVEQENWQSIRNKFIQLKRSNQLPKPKEITLKHIDSYDLESVNLSEAQKYALDMFGDIVEFKED